MAVALSEIAQGGAPRHGGRLAAGIRWRPQEDPAPTRMLVLELGRHHVLAYPLPGREAALPKTPAACLALGRAGPLSGSDVFGFNYIEDPKCQHN